MIGDSTSFTQDTTLGAQYFKPNSTFTAQCTGHGEPTLDGVTRPAFHPSVEPDFLDSTVRYVYLRCRGSSVRTFFLSSTSAYMTSRTFKIKVEAYVHDTGVTHTFYLEDNSNQAATTDGFGEYVSQNDQCTVTFTFTTE